MNTEIDRKIAVIFVADVVGYSKHMEKDENATIKSYNACEAILNKLLKKYKGSVFNTAGDSVLAEFPSAVNAVECGVDFQNEIKKRNQSDKTDVRLEFRLGINMGDVVKKEGNLIGDGVNIAARLEALAQPNGITISKSVYDFVVPKTKMTFNDLGVQKVKQNEFHAFDILLDPSQKRSLKTKPKSNMPLIGAIAAAIVIAFVGMFYFNTSNDSDKQVASSDTSSKPVILVMPIEASGLSEDQKGFARGITESMISTLTQYKSISVLSSSTSFHAQKTKMLDNSIRDEYGVDYLIRGSMQVMNNNARLNLEISNLKIGKVVVTKKKDFQLQEIFKVQDELSNSILSDMQVELVVGSKQGARWASRFDNMQDFTEFLEWRSMIRKGSPEGQRNATEILRKIKSRYPGDEKEFIIVGLEAWTLWQKLLFFPSKDSEKKKDELKRLNYLAKRYLELNKNSHDAHMANAFMGITMLGASCEESLAHVNSAENILLTVQVLEIGANIYARCNELEKAIISTERALQLVPNDSNWLITGNLIVHLYRKGDFDKIYDILEDKIESEDMDNRALAIFSFLENQNGRTKSAEKYLIKAIDNGLSTRRLKMFLIDKDLTEKTISTLHEMKNFD